MKTYKFRQEELTVAAFWNRTNFEIIAGSHQEALETVDHLKGPVESDGKIVIIGNERIHDDLSGTVALKFLNEKGELVTDQSENDQRHSLISYLAHGLAREAFLESDDIDINGYYDRGNEPPLNYQKEVEHNFGVIYDRYSRMLTDLFNFLSIREL